MHVPLHQALVGDNFCRTAMSMVALCRDHSDLTFAFTPLAVCAPLDAKQAEEADLDYLDEDNHVVLAAIRACENSQSWETAVKFLEWSEARWAKRPDTKSGESDSRLAMSELARASRRCPLLELVWIKLSLVTSWISVDKDHRCSCMMSIRYLVFDCHCSQGTR